MRSVLGDIKMDEEFFEKLKEKIMSYFSGGDEHGFDHTERVYKNSLKISDGENVDMDIVKTAALLHDVARFKENKDSSICHAEEGARMAEDILKEFSFPNEKIKHVCDCIVTHRYSKKLKAETREAEILQDADRLDALGAIIISRVFVRCGKRGVPIYDSDVSVSENYDGSVATAINHFYEKSFRITPETFKTVKAREIAKGRYDFVKEFVDRFEKEWRGEL